MMMDHMVHDDHTAAPDPMASMGGHGQLLFGEETVYLSHLPMFMFDPDRHPHNFQVILEVTLSNGGDDPQAAYVAHRQRTRTLIYTLAPERFAMTDLITPDPEHPRLQSFRGTVFEGHFERGGTPILRDIQVQVQKVVYFREFEPDAASLPALKYLLFGQGAELFLAHVITRPPDFDQVLSVQVSGQEFPAEVLRAGLPIVFPGRPNTVEDRLRAGEQITGQIEIAGERGLETVKVEIEAGTEFYFEAGELAMAM